MNISTKGRYALRLMVDLAEHQTKDNNIPLKQIAERQDISLKYLEQIITILTKAGYVRSVRGAQGGYRLTKQLNEYTVGDILRLTEGTLAPVACLCDEPNRCERSEWCPTLFVWEKLYGAINDTVDSITLEDIVERDRANADVGDYII